MITGWLDLLPFTRPRKNQEFVSADARQEGTKDTRSYEMLSKDTSVEVTPLSPVMRSPPPPAGRQTPDYFGQSARYHTPSRSFSSPRPPSPPGATSWDPQRTYAAPQKSYHPTIHEDMNPLGMNRI